MRMSRTLGLLDSITPVTKETIIERLRIFGEFFADNNESSSQSKIIEYSTTDVTELYGVFRRHDLFRSINTKHIYDDIMKTVSPSELPAKLFCNSYAAFLYELASCGTIRVTDTYAPDYMVDSAGSKCFDTYWSNTATTEDFQPGDVIGSADHVSVFLGRDSAGNFITADNFIYGPRFTIEPNFSIVTNWTSILRLKDNLDFSTAPIFGSDGQQTGSKRVYIKK